MAMKRRPRWGGDIDVTAFADIAFLLIIFFILTTTFSSIMGREMTIPSGSKPEKQDEKAIETKTVNISAHEIRYGTDENAPPLSFEALRDRLYREDFPGMATDTERTVIVDAAKDVPYERYFQVITAISSAGGLVAIVEDAEGGS